MKRWVKKTLAYGIVTGAIVGAIAAGVVLSKPIEINKRNYYQVYNANFSNPPYNFDQSASYGYNTSATMTNTTVPMFRQKSIGTAQFDASKGTVIQPTYSFYNMTYADSITVYNNQGKSFTFTSQASNISMANFEGVSQKFTPLSNSDLYTNLSFTSNTNPDLSIPTEENPAPAVQWVISKNDQSINSINFKNWMTPGGLGTGINPTRISVKIKPNLFWTNNQGQKTTYQVVPADFYYSFMRTWLLSPLHRYTSDNPGNGTAGTEGGGSAKIDSAIMSKYSISTRFGPNNTYPNGYVFTNENISMNDLLSESLTLKDDAFNIYASDNSSSTSPAQFYSMFQNQMTNNATFSAAPSQYIQHINTTQAYIDECNTYGITGLSKKFDIYFYGLNADNTLFGGAYVPTTVSPNLSTIIWTKNPNYPDEQFLQSENTINKITWVYNASTNASIFTQNLFSQYLKGNVSTMTYSTLNTTQKNSALEQNLVRPNITQLNNSLLIRTVPVTAPAPDGLNSDGTSNYTYNNAYAKLVYGATLEQLSKGQMGEAANANFFTGLGMQFRSLIHAAVNWYTYGWVSSNSNDIPWVSGFAPDASIGGTDQATAANKTLREAWRNANNASNQDLGPNNIYAWNGQQIIGQNTYYSNENWFNSHFSDLTTQFRTPLFSQIQSAMTNIINEFYTANPSLKGQKISWRLAYGYPQAPTVAIQTAYDGVCDAINALNPNLDVQFVPLTTVNALEGAIIDGFGTSQLAGWGYDYNGIGTAFDASLTQFQSCTALPAFGIFASLPNPATNPLAINFPQFYKLSKFIENWASSPTIAPQLKKMPFSLWASMNNSARQNLQQSISQSINALLANAFLEFQNTCTNDQLIALTQEFNTIIGNSMEMSGQNSLTIPSGFFTFQLVQKWYSNPVIQLGFLYTEDVYVNLENS